MTAGIESMVEFQRDVQKALDDLNVSPAASHHMENHSVELGSTGTFGEAVRLWSAYVNVKLELTNLSTRLCRQIEAMRMTVEYVQGSYEGNEDDFKAKYTSLQADYRNDAPAPARPVEAS